MPEGPTVFFSVFETSGDVLAAGLLRSLREKAPGLRAVGFGGPQMAQAGCELIEQTTEHAVMLHGALSQVNVHRARLRRLEAWLQGNRIDALVPVDSAAANWSICQLARKVQPHVRVVHLVLPQVWAWGGWRVGKLRRLTDHVMCILPFEPDWLAGRRIPGTFVGHPLFDAPRTWPAAADLPDTPGPRIAMLPGSRRSVISHHVPMMLEVSARLQAAHADLHTAFAAVDDNASQAIRDWLGRHPTIDPQRVRIEVDRVDAILDWSTHVLSNSGTATLHVASHRRPMVVVYNASRLMWLMLAKWVIRTRTFALPNVLAERQGRPHIVPEFVPHFGDPEPITATLAGLIDHPGQAADQLAGLDEVCHPFIDRPFGATASSVLLDQLDRRPPARIAAA